MTFVFGSSIIDIQKYSEDVPERNEGVMSAVLTRAMAKQHMQRGPEISTHWELTERNKRACEGPHDPFLLGQHTEV